MRWRRRQSEAPTPTDDEVASFDYIANGIEEVPSFESLANGIASLVVGEASASLTPEVETAAGWQQWQRELENDISAEQSCEAHNANEGVEIRYAPPPPPSPPSVPSPPSRGSKIKGIAGRIASPKLRIRLPKDSNCAEGVSLNLAPQAKKKTKVFPRRGGHPMTAEMTKTRAYSTSTWRWSPSIASSWSMRRTTTMPRCQKRTERK